MKKYLLDDEEFQLTMDGYKITIGEYVEKLLMEQDYYGTRFPKVPVLIERKMKLKLLLTAEKRDRKRKNLDNISKFVKGAIVTAISRKDEDWHEGIIERGEGKMFWVKFF